MSRSIGTALAVGVLAVGVLAAACGNPASTNTAATTTSPPTTVSDTTSASSTSPATPKATGPVKCTSAGLKVTAGGGDAGAGHAFIPIVFTNTSGQACTITGYPGVSFVTGDNGTQVGDPATRVAGGGGTITLGPGEAASAAVSRTNIGVYDPGQCAATDVRGLRIYPPDNTDAQFVPMAGQACSKTIPNQTPLTVKAVVAGANAQ